MHPLLGQPTQVCTYASAISYHPNGAIKQFTYGNGIVHTMSQNVRGLPDTSCDFVGTCTATAVLNDGYDYDQNGNVVAISDGRTLHRGNRTMLYDGLDRLRDTVSPMFGHAGYTYDTLDNLTRVNIGGTAARDQYYCYDAHQQLTNVKTGSCAGASVIGLGYDERGNLANKNGQVFDFDYGNRLREVVGVEAYRYDALGRRVETIKADQSLRLWQYNQSGQLMFGWTGPAPTETTHEYVYLGGSLLAIVDHAWPSNTVTAVKYQHTDALGSPVAVTDANKVVIEKSEYEPFGWLLNRPIKDGPGYAGHVSDAATGLSYMQQRYYWTGGRFLSVDPVSATSVGGNFNRYWYANNNPYKYTDPDGRLVLQIGGTVGGAAVGLIVTAAGDVMRGELSSGGTYAGAAAGGAAAGAVLTTTGNPALAGAAGGAIASAVQQKIDNGQVNPADVATGAVVGGMLGGVAPGLKVPGITSGRNSFAAVAKSAQTKLANGTISRVSATTIGKAAAASGVEGAAGAAVGG